MNWQALRPLDTHVHAQYANLFCAQSFRIRESPWGDPNQNDGLGVVLLNILGNNGIRPL